MYVAIILFCKGCEDYMYVQDFQVKFTNTVGMKQPLPELVSFPADFSPSVGKSTSGNPPIPFRFKCAGMLAHCIILIPEILHCCQRAVYDVTRAMIEIP